MTLLQAPQRAASPETGATAAAPDPRRLTHLKQLEAESIHIIREVAAEFSNPVMLYSIGKDSSVMLHLARKAFHPGCLYMAIGIDPRTVDTESDLRLSDAALRDAMG